MTNKIQYVIFNGPPGSGKSTCARELSMALTQRGFTSELDSFAKPLIQFYMTALGDKYSDIDKARSRPELNGYNLQECFIDMGEKYIKARYGDDIFGRWLVHRSLRFPEKKAQFYIVDDGGFIEEIEAVPNCFVVHVERFGKTFTGDSRGYWLGPAYHIWNNKGLPELWQGINTLSAKLTGMN